MALQDRSVGNVCSISSGDFPIGSDLTQSEANIFQIHPSPGEETLLLPSLVKPLTCIS